MSSCSSFVVVEDSYFTLFPSSIFFPPHNFLVAYKNVTESTDLTHIISTS